MDTFEQLVQEVGTTALARQLGVTPQVLNNWRTRGVPEDAAPLVESVSAGRLPVERTCPHVVWVRVRDPLWKWHKSGRPCKDVVACRNKAGAPEAPTREAAHG